MHARVAAVVDAYLRAVQAEAPGLVEGLYLTGSVALGEFRPRTSDIDYLAVTATPPDTAAVAALARAHHRLRRRHRRPFFDGRYVTWQDLASDPRLVEPGPYSYAGVFFAKGRGACDPVAWHTVAQHGVTCRGPEPSSVMIWIDRAALTAWTLDNFDRYWRPLLASARHGVGTWRLTSFTTYGAVWIVLGVCRLHYTLATGSIASKDEAGRYGLQTFPERWHRVLNEALTIRRADRARADVASAAVEMLADVGWRAAPTRLYESPAARRRDVLAFADMVIADATGRTRPEAG